MIKSCQALVKAVGDAGLAEGQFTAYASIFGNKDSYGDIVMPGAFTDTLSAWQDSGAPIPVYWAHLMSASPYMNLGQILTAAEDEKGLLVTAQLDIADNLDAAYVYKLLKGRRVQQMSFAYDVLDQQETDAGNELKALKLHEVSVVPIGANDQTEVIDVKSYVTHLFGASPILLQAKEGRVLASKHIDSLRAARDQISAVIVAAEKDPEKANEPGPAKSAPAPEEPSQSGSSVGLWDLELTLTEMEYSQ